MPIRVVPSGASCGALVYGVDLSKEPSKDVQCALRAAWLTHQVIALPDQSLSFEDLERFALSMGPAGQDPYIESIAGHPRVIAVRREADEKTPLFAESWHSDWSFLDTPPAGTALYGVEIPPEGGDTLFANQYAAYEALPAATRERIAGLVGIHSARRGYAPNGVYGAADRGRSMAIVYSESAFRIQRHPIVRRHPETGRAALFVSPGYTIGIEGMLEEEAQSLLTELFVHQSEPAFVYRHRWTPGLLTLWDNRCLVHRATGGYEGHRRLLYRITIAESPALARTGEV